MFDNILLLFISSLSNKYVGNNFTRKPPKFERFIRPNALRFKKANVTHPQLKTTFMLDIISVKKNPQSVLYTGLGVITKGTIIEVNVSELGLVTQGGKVVWGKYAQVTNNPENDGCINADLLVYIFFKVFLPFFLFIFFCLFFKVCNVCYLECLNLI